MKKNNELWKLDLLEAKYLQYHARYATTKKLLTARNDEKLWKRLPSTLEEAIPVILHLKSELFLKKTHGSYKKLDKEVGKLVKSDTKPEVVEFFSNPENVQTLLRSRIVKSLIAAILTTKELKATPPEYISEEYRNGVTDKQNSINPSKFFINHCQNNKVLNGFISNLWNNKVVKALIGEIEWSFKTVRGNISREEKLARRVVTGKKPTAKVDAESDNDISEDDDEGDKFAEYDDLVANSEDEANDSDTSVASHDSFFKEDMPKMVKKKHNLPELASGYYSGGSDDEDNFDPEADEVVKDVTKVRKNRRGQRARQQIWEKKFGSGAKHVQETNAKEQSEREQRRIDYEERQRKRELKALGGVANASSSNVIPLGDRKTNSGGIEGTYVSTVVVPVEKAMHPSWLAKKVAEEKEKNVKFAGKKITFD